jgi:hypothetical protein
MKRVERFMVENYLLDVDHPGSETVDFDCVIVVCPSDEQLQFHSGILMRFMAER